MGYNNLFFIFEIPPLKKEVFLCQKNFFTDFKKNMISNNISFGAKYISTPTIQKYDKLQNKFVDKKVSLVEFEPQNLSDKLAIKITNNKWGKYFITQSMYLCADMLSKNETSKDVNKILMLTEQTDNFKKLDATKILALAQTQKNKNVPMELKWLQVNPKFQYLNTSREIKNVGKAVVDSLKKMYDELILDATSNAKKFYIKQGFELVDDINARFHWKR